MKKNHNKEILMLLFVVITGLFFLYSNKNVKQVMPEYQKIVKPFPKVNLVAKSAYIVETETGLEIFNRKAKKQFPIASITKIMTAMVASDILDENEYIKITKDSIKTDGNYGFNTDEEFKAKDLISFMLIGSANDAAVAIGDEIKIKNNNIDFNDVMNSKARILVLNDTYFYNSSGLDREEFVGSYSTAYDIAQMMTYAYKNYGFMDATNDIDITVSSKAGLIHKIENTNDLLKDAHYGPKIMASKTGYTDNAGGSLVVIVKAKNEKLYTIVVLGSTINDRFTDMKKLIDGLDNLE